MELDLFMASHSKKDWSTGSVDCVLTIADWLVWCGFPDVAAPFRGTYDYHEAGAKLMIDEGGAVAFFDNRAALIGLKRITMPRRGSVAIIGSITKTDRQLGAIFDGRRWQIRYSGGFHPMIGKPHGIWSIPNG